MKRWSVFCVMTLLFANYISTGLCAALDKTEIDALFADANVLFHQAAESASENSETAKQLYQKSVMRLERIVRDGQIHNGKLYYNIANTYFRMGNLGKAILNYRLAEDINANDINVQQNLGFARSKRKDTIEEKATAKILKTVLFWHYDLSLETRAIIFVFGFLLLWLTLTIRLFWVNSIPRGIPIFLALFACVFLSSVVIDRVLAERNVAGVIIADEVIARKGDGTSYQPSFKEPLHAGTEFLLVEERNDWYQIALGDNRYCWIPTKDAGLVVHY